ncbi:MAG TPA: hypothetical protein VGF65_05910 [Mycobacterium sp.]
MRPTPMPVPDLFELDRARRRQEKELRQQTTLSWTAIAAIALLALLILFIALL